MGLQRSGTRSGLSAAVERLSANAGEWGPQRVLDEGLDLIRDSTWADVSLLYALDRRVARVVAGRPDPRAAETGVPVAGIAPVQPRDWFPWGLAPVSPKRYLLVEDAAELTATPSGGTVGQLGMRSCLHLPIMERSTPVGAIHLYWAEPRLAWDDDRGRLLRMLGAFLLGTALPG